MRPPTDDELDEVALDPKFACICDWFEKKGLLRVGKEKLGDVAPDARLGPGEVGRVQEDWD